MKMLDFCSALWTVADDPPPPATATCLGKRLM